MGNEKFDEIHISYELLQHSRRSIFCKRSNLEISDTILFDDKSLYSIRNSIRSVLSSLANFWIDCVFLIFFFSI